jgi:hypothetical protein
MGIFDVFGKAKKEVQAEEEAKEKELEAQT